MKMITLIWDEAALTGRVQFHQEFSNAHVATQLDCLQDCLHELEEKYHSMLAPITDATK